MRALVFLEHHDGELQKGSLGVLAKAASLGGEVAAVLVGDAGVKALASDAGAFGATTVYAVCDDAFEPPLPQPRVDALAQVVSAEGYDTVLLANSVLAADIAAGLAARLDAGLNWDLVDLEQRGEELVGKRPALADSVMVEVGWVAAPRIALFRGGSFEPVAGERVEVPVRDVGVEPSGHATLARVVERRSPEDTGPSLQDAEIIVAGGMGLGGPENFALAEELAAALGGAVGATRAVVYAGWYPHGAQVGQTGQTVSPKLYVALGISGAIQHKVGMQNSKVIVSVNKDAGAAIFEFSDLAVVGDLHDIVPKLTELVRQRKGMA
jgi:electron transfer flavoprotein alpha subunit